MTNQNPELTEHQQALSNSLNHLSKHPNPQAQQVIELLNSGDLTIASETLKALALGIPDKRDAAKLWVDLGNISTLLSAEQALDAYRKAVTLDTDNINAWNRIGHLERAQKNYDQAEIAYRNVTRLSGELSQTQALSFANFGLLHQSQNRYADAIESFKEALKINTAISNPAGAASNHENLASLYRLTQDNLQAETHYKAAFNHYKNTGNTGKRLELHTALGNLYQQIQKTDLAMAEYEQALALSQDSPNKRLLANLYANLGILSQQKKDPEKAEAYFNQALVLYQAEKQNKEIADQYGNLAVIARGKKAFEESESLHLKAIELYQQENKLQAISNQLINLGFLYTAWGKRTLACENWQKSLNAMESDNGSERRQRIEEIVNRDCQSEP